MIDVQSREVPAKPQPKMGKATSAIRGFKEELKKVSWTSKVELQFFTKLVLGATFFLESASILWIWLLRVFYK